MKRTGKIGGIALVLVIIGGINWGLRIFDFNIVYFLFGESRFADLLYGLTGLSALYTLFYVLKK